VLLHTKMQASLSICSIRRAVVLFLPLICFSRRTAGEMCSTSLHFMSVILDALVW